MMENGDVVPRQSLPSFQSNLLNLHFHFLSFSLFMFCDRITRTEVSGQPMSVESFSLIDPCKYVAVVFSAHV